MDVDVDVDLDMVVRTLKGRECDGGTHVLGIQIAHTQTYLEPAAARDRDKHRCHGNDGHRHANARGLGHLSAATTAFIIGQFVSTPFAT